ncbi:hypothetical protein [Mangrovimonas futianensis]|uniref:hypothetical protein n=1 Tax=Mangrovimonas futianensis TaxID=2895523 RepID=UPI001E629232|nr:hypothetical protein [Mangrovimonas futianensis]MCF1422942.1 hypothetical protein [Mangrovimonas futianensis]
MNSFKIIISLFNKSPQVREGKTTEDFCPNCWGRQEYGGTIYKPLKTESLENKTHKKGWIRAYIEQNVKLLQLEPKEKKQVCNVCFESCNN